MKLFIGTVVLNFGSVAKVVGFFDGYPGHPNQGCPILESITPGGKSYGGTWVADPVKVDVLTPEQIAAYATGNLRAFLASVENPKPVVTFPVHFYRWSEGVSRLPTAIIRNGRTLYGPVSVAKGGR